MITANTYFSGAGLFDIGLIQGGLNIQQSFEIDPICINTQKMNFDHDIVQCDIRNKLVKDEKECDVMVATFPCNKYSTIADIHNTRSGDDLFLHYFRHVAIQKPEIFINENVPGMKKFPVVMEALTKLPDYYVTVFCPVKADNWLPQQRDRLIIIGSKKPFNWRPPEQQKRVLLSEILEPNPKIKIPKYVYNRLNGKYRDLPIISDPESNDLAPTCVAHYAKDIGTRLVKDDRFRNGVRPYTPLEYARLQGVPDWFKFSGTDRQAYKQIGNGVPVPIGIWVANELKRYFK